MQYKLKHSTLENLAGDIFTEREINGQAMLVPPSGDATRAIPMTSMANGKLEQFFDLIEMDLDRTFRPEIGDDYFFMDSQGNIKSATNGQTVVDVARFDMGNVFSTEAAANASIKFLQARAAIITNPINQFKPDWANGVIEVEREVIGDDGQVVLDEDTQPVMQTVLEAQIVGWFIAFDKVANRYLPTPASGHRAPQAIAYYDSEAAAAEAYTNQKEAYKAYFGGL